MFCKCNQKQGSLAIILRALGHIVAIIGLWQHSWPMIVLAAILFVLSFMDWTSKAKEEVKTEEQPVAEESYKEEVEKIQENAWTNPAEVKIEPVVGVEPVAEMPEVNVTVEMPEMPDMPKMPSMPEMPEMPEMPKEKASETV